MHWKYRNSTPAQEGYELWNGSQQLLTVDFHPFTNNARIEYPGEKRVFMIRKEGFLRNKMVLRNEYGILIGQLHIDKSNATAGTIELNGDKFVYQLKIGDDDQLVIHKEHSETPFVVCDITAANDDTATHFSKETPLTTSRHFLLLALCWFTSLKAADTTDKVLELV